VECAKAAGIRHVCVSTDDQSLRADDVHADVLWRVADLAADDTPMAAVVEDFLARMVLLYTATNEFWTGKPAQQTLDEQIIVLLQPTQPLRKPAHVREAIRLLQESKADSVVSVKALPLTHSPDLVCHIMNGQLYGIHYGEDGWACYGVARQPSRRQDVEPVYIRDGTVYAFYRRTVEREGNIYGKRVIPLIIPPEETCELDTPEDWARLEARVTHAE
jgi:CMP-N-acetylneuraminic acid synthetase